MSQSFLYLGRCNSLCHHFGILRGKLKQRYFCFWWEKKIIKSMKLYSFCLHLKYGKGQQRREEKKRHTNWSWQLRFKIISLVILWCSLTSGCSVCVSQPVYSLSCVLDNIYGSCGTHQIFIQYHCLDWPGREFPQRAFSYQKS